MSTGARQPGQPPCGMERCTRASPRGSPPRPVLAALTAGTRPPRTACSQLWGRRGMRRCGGPSRRWHRSSRRQTAGNPGCGSLGGRSARPGRGGQPRALGRAPATGWRLLRPPPLPAAPWRHAAVPGCGCRHGWRVRVSMWRASTPMRRHVERLPQGTPQRPQRLVGLPAACVSYPLACLASLVAIPSTAAPAHSGAAGCRSLCAKGGSKYTCTSKKAVCAGASGVSSHFHHAFNIQGRVKRAASEQALALPCP